MKYNKTLTMLICSLTLVDVNSIVNADPVASSNLSQNITNSQSVSNQMKSFNNSDEIVEYEYNWFKSHTRLNDKAISALIACALYETNNNPNFTQNGEKGILTWNSNTPIQIGNDPNALSSQLNHLKTTMTLQNNSIIYHLNHSKNVLDAALYFEKNYEGNQNFFKNANRISDYKCHLHTLSKKVTLAKHEVSSVTTKQKYMSLNKDKSISLSEVNNNSNINSIYNYLKQNTTLNNNAIKAVCAVILHESNGNPDFKSKTGSGLLNWKDKPVPMNGNQKMSQLEQQELYLKDTINPKLVNELNRQKDAESAAKTFAREYCHLVQKVNWMKYVSRVNKER